MVRTGKYCLPILFFILVCTISKGQKNEIGGSLGVLNYRGELAPQPNPLFSRPAGLIFFRRNFSPVVALRFGVTLGGLYANDKNYSSALAKTRSASFSGLLSEASVMVEYNFFNYILDYLQRKKVTKYSPYLTAGLALFNAQTTSNNPDYGTETNTQIAIPIGVGLKYMLNPQWNLGVEVVARKTFTDRIDGINNTSVGGKLVGDTEDNDTYYYVGVSISYTFYKVHCPREHFH